MFQITLPLIIMRIYEISDVTSNASAMLDDNAKLTLSKGW